MMDEPGERGFSSSIDEVDGAILPPATIA